MTMVVTSNKRVKRTNSNDTDDDNRIKIAASSVDTPSLEDIEKFFQSFADDIRNFDLTTSASGGADGGTGDGLGYELLSSLLTLKAWQHDLLAQLDNSQAELDQAHKRHERQERALAALTYEKEYLDRELDTCRNFELKFLKQLAHEELGPKALSSDMDEDGNETALLSNFLQANVHDPNDKEKIVAKLHQELSARGGLESNLKLKEQELQKLRQELQNQNSFLQSLPDHLASMERASLPLQKFMATKIPKGTAFTARLIGTERQQRLQLAQSLPAPLYTLFQQLQYYVDRPTPAVSDQDSALEEGLTNSIALSITSGEASDKEVILQLPVPNISSQSTSNNPGRHKRVSIHFHYYPISNVVTAVASGCGTTLNQEILLDELFPGDNPDRIDETVGRPYQWCNYLAGLHHVPQQKLSAVQNSTRVILQELQRRVRANATLKHILHSLQRLHLPLPISHQKQDVATTTCCKLVKFSGEKLSDNYTSGRDQQETLLKKTYFVSLVPPNNTNDNRYNFQVSLHLARYPAVPPVWTLNGSKSDDSHEENTSLLYDSHLASIEQYVNVVGLEELVHPRDGDAAAAAADSNDESLYEWILSLQLRHIMCKLNSDDNETTSAMLAETTA